MTMMVFADAPISKQLFSNVADASKGGFGEVTFDDFSAERRLVAD
jgi:hypothetical protein